MASRTWPCVTESLVSLGTEDPAMVTTAKLSDYTTVWNRNLEIAAKLSDYTTVWNWRLETTAELSYYTKARNRTF